MKSRRDFLTGAGAGAAFAAAGAVVWDNLTPREGTPPHAKLSFAQTGEDLVVDYILFQYLKLPRASYLDIGAWHPVEMSNTYLLYLKDCRGILVEPNVALIAALQRERPADIVLNVGIGFGDPTVADYYVLNKSAWNTFDREEAEKGVEQGAIIERVIQMPLVNVNEVIAKHLGAAPDFVSIDTEGLDLPILKTFDFARYRPPVFCIETLIPYSRAVPAIGEFMADHGYVPRGGSVLNTIFVDKQRIKF